MEEVRIQSSEVVVTEHMMNSMRSTKPWAMFLSIMGFIGVGFMVVAGLIVIVAGKHLSATGGTGFSALLGVFYIAAAVVYLFPSIYLFKYSQSISRFLVNKQGLDMESALACQKSFWKFVGILCLICTILAAVGILAAVIIAAVAGFR